MNQDDVLLAGVAMLIIAGTWGLLCGTRLFRGPLHFYGSAGLFAISWVIIYLGL